MQQRIQVLDRCYAEKGGDPEAIRESQRRRFADVGLVDKVLELDAEWRTGMPHVAILDWSARR